MDYPTPCRPLLSLSIHQMSRVLRPVFLPISHFKSEPVQAARPEGPNSKASSSPEQTFATPFHSPSKPPFHSPAFRHITTCCTHLRASAFKRPTKEVTPTERHGLPCTCDRAGTRSFVPQQCGHGVNQRHGVPSPSADVKVTLFVVHTPPAVSGV